MVQFNVFNIGTKHNRLEKTNLLVKLFNDCKVNEIRHEDVTATKELGVSIPASNYKYINDGVGSYDPGSGMQGGSNSKHPLGNMMGAGLAGKRGNTIETILAMETLPSQINLCGHSRGAVLCIEIAAVLWQNPKTKGIPINMFLLDPCKFSLQSNVGGKNVSKTFYPNVQNLMIVAAEDVHNICGYDGGFHLLKTIDKRTTSGKSYKDWRHTWELRGKNYIRMPGQHGTGSQVNGMPIGEVTYQIARRLLKSWGAKIGATGDVWDDVKLCNEYFRIHIENPMTIKNVNIMKKIMGYTRHTRRINDGSGFISKTTDSRAKALNKMGVKNRWRGHEFFINNHHHVLFRKAFPTIAGFFEAIDKNPRVTLESHLVNRKHRLYQFKREIRQMGRMCPNGHTILGNAIDFNAVNSI